MASMQASRLAPIALACALFPALLGACNKSKEKAPPPLAVYALREGEAVARRDHKLALVFFGADWSTADKELEYTTFPDPQVREALRDWVVIKVDMTDEDTPGLNEAKERFKIIGDPTTILIDLEDPQIGELNRFNEFVKPITMASAIYAAAARARSLRAAAR